MLLTLKVNLFILLIVRVHHNYELKNKLKITNVKWFTSNMKIDLLHSLS